MTLSVFKFEQNGVEIRKALLSSEIIEFVKSDIDLESAKLQQYGVRNPEKRFDSIYTLASSPKILSIAERLLKARVSLVRALFFDKTPSKNWFVTWHQDKTVTLNKRIDIEGWGPWSIKDGVHHVQPPLPILNTMITFRLHIDPADEENGCLEVIPGSHEHGLLKQTEIEAIVKSGIAVPCVVEAGDAVIMRPHILHSSSKAKRPNHRRVVHLEYSGYERPDGINWVSAQTRTLMSALLKNQSSFIVLLLRNISVHILKTAMSAIAVNLTFIVRILNVDFWPTTDLCKVGKG